MIFGDTVLRDLARVRPSTPERMRQIIGVGDVKLRNFGSHFLPVIAEHCRAHGLAMDVGVPSSPPPLFRESSSSSPPRANPRQVVAFDLFRKETAVEDAMKQMDLKRSTIQGYLEEYIRAERPGSISKWVPDALYQRIAAAARQVGTERLRPIFIALGEKVAYDDIRPGGGASAGGGGRAVPGGGVKAALHAEIWPGGWGNAIQDYTASSRDSAVGYRWRGDLRCMAHRPDRGVLLRQVRHAFPGLRHLGPGHGALPG